MAMMRLRREDPRIVGPYRLHRRLGAGGMGVVYLGSDRKGQRVALKLIRAELAEDAEFRTRFAREIAAASRIRGGCTARVVGSDIEADRPWLATTYVPGPSLYKRVGDEGPLPWPEAARIGAALADGLVKVHEAGVVHRDLKPSNILLSPKGPRIIDFGIAWSRGASTLTHVGTAVGSPGFLAPEQVRGAAVTPATDVFAFGATLAFALTGDSPFGSGASSEVMLYRVVHEEPDLAAVPPALAPLVRACLAKESAERPPAAALHERLAELAARGTALGPQTGGGAFGRGRFGGAGAGPAAEAAAGAGPAEGEAVLPAQHGQQQGQQPGQQHGPHGAVAGGRGGPSRVAGRGGAAPGGESAPRPAAGPGQAGGRPRPGAGPGPGARRPARPYGQAPTAPMPRQEFVEAGRDGTRGGTREGARDGRDTRGGREVRERTPVPGRERQHSTLSGRSPAARRRLLRQRVVVFVTVTVGVALAIAAAQGCENRDARGLGPAAGVSAHAMPPVPPLSIDGAAAAGGEDVRPRVDGVAGGGLGPAVGSMPVVDWTNRTYGDPAGGPAIQLRDGQAASGAGAPVSLTAVLPAHYRDAQAEVVVLRRLEGAVPVDLVQLFGFNADAPVLLASRTSAADPRATAAWRVENGALIREERVTQTGASSSTRYIVRADGGIEESWPGAGVSGTVTAH
ncbi:serine/threonine-protein kinase [Kitasatospora sp. NPDC048365]|uniref:serine/threonine-protein kinase n=1 Tax=Kitasatospora sp. NPDC048365 TaxID=3364050 RepID=UPI00371FA521